MTFGSTRPFLTFAVGVSGHRPTKIPAGERPRIEGQLRAVFAVIDASCARAQVRLLTGFAEGADQMAVAATPDGWIVEAILPLPRAVFAKDFTPGRSADGVDRVPQFEQALSRADKIVELPGPQPGIDGTAQAEDENASANAAYARQGAFLVRAIDLLIAVWDGLESSGRGGTAEVVSDALSNGVPVVWIAAAEDRPPLLLATGDDLRNKTPRLDATRGPLQEVVAGKLRLSAR